MKKRFMLMLLLFALMVGLSPRSITQAQTTNTQGEQFEQGNYDLQAESPFGQNWNRNSPFTGTENPKVKWEYKVYYKDASLGSDVRQFYTPPAIGRDGTIYAANQNGKLFALNKDGSVKWAKDNLVTMDSVPVIAEDGTIYVSRGSLTAVNPDGSIKWRTKDSVAASMPVLDHDGTIYVHNYQTKRLEAYNPDGTKKWSSNEVADGYIGYGSMLISKDGIIYTLVGVLGNKHLYAHDKNGKELWHKCVPGDYFGNGFALGKNNEIFLNTRDQLYVFNNNGNIVHQWKEKDKEVLLSAPTVSSTDGTIYVGGENYLYAYNPDYSLKWKYRIEGIGSVYEAPVIDKNGVIYFRTSRDMYALNPDATLKWKFNHSAFRFGSPNSSIVIDKDGTLYIPGDWYSGGVPKVEDRYFSIMAIGDDYTDNVCTKESTYMEVLKSLRAKSKKAKLTEDEKKEARDILKELSGDLDKKDN
ncbi:PQQ-binding-like beta-propeller repeat protein [Bacillus cytotoxicus]|uniref:PQQ-binding-like beta-propeller repeat protein n=1 Tax=Bacillus cytotoxicus TaxID=580165 RepID=A0ACC6A7M5_9BACI|nr:PQQ-binding-like beta-propeller repeat protein [Bacillus cytotoxicus]